MAECQVAATNFEDQGGANESSEGEKVGQRCVEGGFYRATLKYKWEGCCAVLCSVHVFS